MSLNRVELSILVGAAAAAVALLGVTAVYPSVDDLWVENPFWNGLSEFYIAVKPLRLGDLFELGSVSAANNSTLFILGPNNEYGEAEANSIKAYLGRGGAVVIADDYGSGNQLLTKLGLEPMFRVDVVLRDPLFRDRDSLLPVISSVDYPGIDRIVLNYATVLWAVEGFKVVAWSSPLSYLASSVDEAPRIFEPNPVIAEAAVMGGRLVVISDSSVFINSMIGRGDNKMLLERISRGQAIIDEAHSTPSRLTAIKQSLIYIYTVLGNLELRYGLTLLLTAAIMWVRISNGRGADPVEEVMKRHPEYDRRLVERLNDMRSDAGGNE